jgi:AraC-like DNA-binding protein
LAATPYFRQIKHGIDFMPEKFTLPRHRHFRPYATVVLSGRFIENGYIGRVCTAPGDVIIHPSLDCHENEMFTNSIRIIRLEWHDSYGAGGLFQIEDADAIARAAEKDVTLATALLREELSKRKKITPNRKDDWPDLLAANLRQNVSLELTAWAESHGLALETVSRGFAQAYGVPPKVFRAELRTRNAWVRITRTRDPLSAIAADTGFADQSHMTHWIRSMTGQPPTHWRSTALQPRAGFGAADPGLHTRATPAFSAGVL